MRFLLAKKVDKNGLFIYNISTVYEPKNYIFVR